MNNISTFSNNSSDDTKHEEIFHLSQVKFYPISENGFRGHNSLAMNGIQKRITRRLEELGITPNYASDKAGLDNSYLRSFLARENPSMRGLTAKKLAIALKTTPEWLLYDVAKGDKQLGSDAMRLDPEMLRKATFSAKQLLAQSGVSLQHPLDEYRMICYLYEQEYRAANDLPPLEAEGSPLSK